MNYIKKVAFRHSNGNFLCLDSTNVSLAFKRTTIGEPEVFSLYQDDQGFIALQASNGKFVSAVNTGGSDVAVNGPAIDTWETLRLIDMGNYNVALQTGNGQYMNFADVTNQLPVNRAIFDKTGGTSIHTWIVKANADKITAATTLSLYDIDKLVSIYTDDHYNGPYQVLLDDNYNTANLIIGNKQVSSLKIPDGKQVILYDSDGQTGKTKIFTDDAPFVGDDFNDATSSIKVIHVPAATIYVDKDYNGGSQVLYAGSYDISSLSIGNDQLSSLHVSNGYQVTLYADRGFTGNTKIITQDTPWIGFDFNDIVSSIKVEKLPFAVIYNDANFSGTQQRLYTGSYDTSALYGGDNQVSSLQVPVGLQVTLYDGPGFSGATQVYTEDTPWIGNEFNDRTSSVKVAAINTQNAMAAVPAAVTTYTVTNPAGVKTQAESLAAKVVTLSAATPVPAVTDSNQSATQTLSTAALPQYDLLQKLQGATSNASLALSKDMLGSFSGVMDTALSTLGNMASIDNVSVNLVTINQGESGAKGEPIALTADSITIANSLNAAVQVAGTLTLFSRFAVSLQYAEFSQLRGTPYGVLKFISSGSYTITDIIPGASSVSFLQNIPLPSPVIVVSSSGDLFDPELNYAIAEGFNFFLTLPVAESGNEVIQFIGGITKVSDIGLHGVMDLSSAPPSFLFEADIVIDPTFYIINTDAFKFRFAKTSMGIAVKGGDPSFSIANQVVVVITFKDETTELLFTGGVAVDPLTLTGFFAMQAESADGYTSAGGTVVSDGEWKNPFGIPYLTLRELAVQVSFSYAPPWISGIGIHGNMQVGNIDGSASILINADEPQKFLIAGATDSINILDIVSAITPETLIAYQAVSSKYPQIDNFIKIYLENVTINIAPEPVTIATFTYEQGFTVIGTLDVWGWKAGMYIKADKDTGVDIRGVMDKIDLSVKGTRLFSVTDCFDTSKGPSLSMQFNWTTTPALFISSNIYFLGFNQQVYINANADQGFTFYIRQQLANVLDMQLNCTLNKSKLELDINGSIVFNLNLSISTKFGTLNLVNISLTAAAVFTVSPDIFYCKLSGTFQYFGHSITMPDLAINVAPSDVYAIAKAVADQIKNNADALFTDVFKRLEDWANAVNTFAVNTEGKLADIAQKAFNATKDDAIKAFNIANAGAEEVVKGLKNVYHTTIDDVTTICKSLQHDATEVGNAIKNEFNADVNAVAGTLKQAAYAVNDVANSVKNTFNADVNVVSSALKNVGYSIDEAGSALASTFTGIGQDAINKALSAAGYIKDVVETYLVGHVQTTNQTSQRVWITIYDLGKTKHLDWGWLDAGATRSWGSGNYLKGSVYHVRGEVKQDANGSDPNRDDEWIQIYIQATTSSPYAKGYAVSIVHDSGNNYHWNHDN